jgi:hypothetical protein
MDLSPPTSTIIFLNNEKLFSSIVMLCLVAGLFKYMLRGKNYETYPGNIIVKIDNILF